MFFQHFFQFCHDLDHYLPYLSGRSKLEFSLRRDGNSRHIIQFFSGNPNQERVFSSEHKMEGIQQYKMVKIGFTILS